MPLASWVLNRQLMVARAALAVGEGEFAPVAPEVLNFSVSRFQVVRSWLDRRKLNRSGKQSSPLDEIRPERWAFTEELPAPGWSCFG